MNHREHRSEKKIKTIKPLIEQIKINSVDLVDLSKITRTKKIEPQRTSSSQRKEGEKIYNWNHRFYRLNR